MKNNGFEEDFFVSNVYLEHSSQTNYSRTWFCIQLSFVSVGSISFVEAIKFRPFAFNLAKSAILEAADFLNIESLILSEQIAVLFVEVAKLSSLYFFKVKMSFCTYPYFHGQAYSQLSFVELCSPLLGAVQLF